MPDEDAPLNPGRGAPDAAPSFDGDEPSPDPDSGTGAVHVEDVSATACAADDPGPLEAGNLSDTVQRLLAIVEDMQRTASSSHDSGKGFGADIIARIERLESWVATNRNQ